MQEYQAIQTSLGILRGRDAIYLDRVDVQITSGILSLVGNISGSLCSEPQTQDWISYQLSFYGVLAFKVIELDSWDHGSSSSFDEIVNSNWIRELGGKVTPSHKHYLVQTYDDVMEVVCKRYDLQIMKGEDGD